jgi:hypothetical protein
MTARKSDLKLSRTPRFVSRETGASELEISPETWDRWVEEGRLPSAATGFPSTTPRWRWDDVDRKLAGKSVGDSDAFVSAVSSHLHGPQKGRGRHAA